MALTPSAMIELGTKMPVFQLPDTIGNTIGNRGYHGTPVLVAFWCNHCPYVIHVQDRFVELARQWEGKGLGVVAINSNDVTTHPEDSPERMLERAQEAGYTFPYLFDETQEIARSFGATCTPDFFLYDSSHTLVYRGQFDDTRPGGGNPTGADLNAAVEALLGGQEIPEDQIPSAGCNIKWK
ncbi:MAG: thioredoxin family protein [Phycisphaerales bacterium JB043]